jgi:cytochrome P450
MLTIDTISRYILKNNNDKGMSNVEIRMNSEALIVAGSETTATCLSGTMYYLCKDPELLRIVVDEVRSMFASEDDITIKTTMNLTYMQACIEESLRMFPPVVVSPTRVSPGDFVGGYYLPKNVSFVQ